MNPLHSSLAVGTPQAEETAPAPERVVIGFSTPSKWNILSWLIRILTRSRASHVWLLVDDPIFMIRMVMEAHITGYRFVPLTKFSKTNAIVALAQPKADLSVGVAVAGSWLGSRYDFAGIFGMIVVLLGRWLHLKWKNPAQSARAMFCSEAVVRALQAAHHPGFEKVDPDDLSPQDLLERLEDDPNCHVVPRSALKL